MESNSRGEEQRVRLIVPSDIAKQDLEIVWSSSQRSDLSRDLQGLFGYKAIETARILMLGECVGAEPAERQSEQRNLSELPSTTRWISF